MATSWHVGTPEVTTYGARAQAGSHRPVDDGVAGYALPSAAVPKGLLGYTEREVITWRDEESAEAWGSLWRGEHEAEAVMQTVEAVTAEIDDKLLDAYSPGLGALEREFAEKVTRLDGEFTLEWTHPEGLIEDGWRYKPAEGEEKRLDTDVEGYRSYLPMRTWLEWMRAGTAMMARTGERLLPSRFTESEWGWDAPDTDYALRMMTFDATTHHGIGTSDSGYSTASLVAHMRLSYGLQIGEVSYEEVDRRLEQLLGIGVTATQFKRMQPGRKAVRKYVYSPHLRRPAMFQSAKNLLPRFRAVWAPPKWWNDGWRRAAGRLTTIQRSSRQAQVRAQVVQSIIHAWGAKLGPSALRVALTAGVARPDDYVILALDYSAMDLHIEQSALDALATLSRTIDPSIQKAMADSAARMPVLTPSIIPGSAAHVFKRQGRMLSGWLMTSAGDSIVNVAALLWAIGQMLGTDAKQTAALVEAGVIDFLVAGDDTLIRWPRSLDYKRLIAALARIGMPVSIVETRSFLARQYATDASSYTNYVFRQIQNQWFEEERSRQTNEHIVLAGVVQRRHLIRNHPQARLYDEVMRVHRPDVLNKARQYDAGDIPAILARAKREGIDDRAARGLLNLGHAIDPEMMYGGMPGEEDVIGEAISNMVGRRMLNSATAYRAARDCGFTLKDVFAVFEARSERLPLPAPQADKLRGVTLR